MKYRDEVRNSGYLHGIIETKFSEREHISTDIQRCATSTGKAAS